MVVVGGGVGRVSSTLFDKGLRHKMQFLKECLVYTDVTHAQQFFLLKLKFKRSVLYVRSFKIT